MSFPISFKPADITKHASLPWCLCSSGSCFVRESNPLGNATIAQCYPYPTEPEVENAQANAAFIVHACNCHYQLVEALEEALPYLQYLASNGSGNRDAEKTCDMAEQALSLAKGTK